MSRWFRWYQGTAEDAKLRLVAKRSRVTGGVSRVTVRDVIAVWAVMLEDASSLDHPGVCTKDVELIEMMLDFDDGQAAPIISNLIAMGMVESCGDDLSICNWGKRQFRSDADPTAADRQRRKRARDKGIDHAPVTRDSRNQSRTESDTDTEILSKSDDFDAFWGSYPRKEAKGRAQRAFAAALRQASIETILAGLRCYQWPAERKFWPLPATWLNDRRWEDGDHAPKAMPMGAEARQKARLESIASCVEKGFTNNLSATDHDLAELVRAGRITEDQARSAGWSGIKLVA